MSKSSVLFFGALAVAAASLYLLTLREGHDWGDDFALYIAHARNLAEGKPYAATSYVYNPAFAEMSPPAYPPGYPVLLAPVYALFGLNFTAMKVLNILLFAAFVLLCPLGFRRQLPPVALVVLTILIAFHPEFWKLRDDIITEMPFLLFLYAALFAMNTWVGPDQPTLSLPRAVGIGVLMFWASAIRTVGILLVPSLLLAELVTYRRVRWRTLLVLGVCLGLKVLQTMVFGGEGGYLDQVTGLATAAVRNLRLNAGAYLSLWHNGVSRWGQFGLAALVSGLALVGYVVRCCKGATVLEIFPVVYTPVILAWPAFQGNRFMLPLVPLILFFALVGAITCAEALRPRVVASACVGLGALIAAAYLGTYLQADYGPLREGIHQAEAQDLFRFVREHTPPDAVVLFQKPRALALLTDRRGGYGAVSTGEEGLWAALRHLHATYLIVTHGKHGDSGYLLPVIELHPETFTEEFANDNFRVYRVSQAALR